MADVDIQWLTPELVRVSVSPGRDGLGKIVYDPSDSAQGSFISIGKKHKILQITPVTGVGHTPSALRAGNEVSITTAFLLLVEPWPEAKPIGIPPCP